MSSVLRLSRLALMVWLAWLGLIALMIGMLAASAWHPHFLPATTLLVIMILAGLALLIGGLWRLVRGPRRLHTLACLLIGMAPLWFFAGHFLYGLRAGHGRNVVMNLPLKMLGPLGESIFDLLARFLYPHRTYGETVVMISTPVANAREQVAAMDRHVRALWVRLGGKTTTRRVHWLRGGMLGMGGHAIYGVCMGSQPGEGTPDAEGLTGLDRHEVAHCVLSSFMSTEMDPPALLSEGWAQANMGEDEAAVALNAWERREQGDALSLRQLTGPDWYSRHHWPAYNQGAALVNYLLLRYGPDKFMEFFRTVRPGRFDADCRRVLGVSVDELDAAYWADIDRQVEGVGDVAMRLKALKVRPPVDRAAWLAFVDEYLKESARLLAPYDHARVTGERSYSSTGEGGKPQADIHRFDWRRSGASRALIMRYSHSGDVYLATPRTSFHAWRESDKKPWEIHDNPKETPDAAYRRVRNAIDEVDPFREVATMLGELVHELRLRSDTSTVVVTQFERFSEEGRPFVRIRLEDTSSPPLSWRHVSMVLAADDSYAARSDEIELHDGTTLRGEFAYDRQDGMPVIRSLRTTGTDARGKPRTIELKILERTFGPIPESEFAAERLLDGPVVHKSADPNDIYRDPPTFADWYQAPLVGGVISLALGLAVGLLGWRRSSGRAEVHDAVAP